MRRADATAPTGSPACPTPSLAATLRATRWQHRVLLIGAPTANQPDFQAQKRCSQRLPLACEARDFQVIELPYRPAFRPPTAAPGLSS
ncbi:MAG: DUF4174 domain-containing protein [Hymenobacter sp.]